MQWVNGSKDNYFQVTLKQVAETRKIYGFENQESIDQAVDILQQWVKQQSHFVFKDFDRKYLEAFIIRAKGSVERAKKRLDKLCTLKTLLPEVFHNIDVLAEGEKFNKHIKGIAIPRVLPDNHTAIVLKYQTADDLESGGLTLINLVRLTVATSEYCIVKDYSVGYEIIIDMTRAPLSRLITFCNPALMQKTLTVLMEGYGVRMKRFHLIYPSKLISTLVTVLKQGMGEKMASRIMVHNDYESLRNHFPKEYLPSDFGGDLQSVEEFLEKFFEVMCSEEHQQRLKDAISWRTDESKRLGQTFNEEYLGMPGTFRALVVD